MEKIVLINIFIFKFPFQRKRAQAEPSRNARRQDTAIRRGRKVLKVTLTRLLSGVFPLSDGGKDAIRRVLCQFS